MFDILTRTDEGNLYVKFDIGYLLSISLTQEQQAKIRQETIRREEAREAAHQANVQHELQKIEDA